MVCLTILLILLFSRDDKFELLARRLHLSAYSEIADDEPDPGPTTRTPAIIRHCIAHLRTELGLLSHSPANVKVVSDVARRYLKDRGLRPSHISRLFPEAVEMYFLASPEDRELLGARNSRYARAWRRGAGEAL